MTYNEWAQLEHVVAENGTVKNPIDRNAIFMTVELIISIVGILMNSAITCIIIFIKKLRTKPRNIFLLGIVLSNLTTSVRVLMEFSYFISPNQELCQMYVAIAGLPHVLFLTNLLLALVDRYAAIVHPSWHKEKVTVRLAFFSQLGASISISVIYKFAYIAQFIYLNCELKLIQLKIANVILLILYSSCIVLQIIVYRRAREILGNYGRRAEMAKAPVSNFPVIIFNLIAQQVISLPNSALPVVGLASTPESLNVHIPDSSINQLEIEATTTLIASVTFLSVVNGPIILYTFVVFICRLFIEKHVCISISWLAPYVLALVVLHVVYYPTFYLLRSSELFSAVKRWFKR